MEAAACRNTKSNFMTKPMAPNRRKSLFWLWMRKCGLRSCAGRASPGGRAFTAGAVLQASGDGIFEIRTKFGSDITRVLYFFVIGRRIILTNGFVKKTQKTPASEIALAKQYRADYLSRKEYSK